MQRVITILRDHSHPKSKLPRLFVERARMTADGNLTAHSCCSHRPIAAAAAASTHPESPALIQRTRITLQPGGPGPTDYELLPVASMDGIPRVQQNVRLHTMVHVLLCHHYPFLPRSPPRPLLPCTTLISSTTMTHPKRNILKQT